MEYKKSVGILCMGLVTLAACSAFQTPEGTPKKVEPNRVCYSLGTSYGVIQPSVNVVIDSPNIVTNEVALRFDQSDRSVVAMFDACVIAAAVANDEGLDTQVVNILSTTQELSALIESFKIKPVDDGDREKPSSDEITQFTARLVLSTVVGIEKGRQLRERLADPTPITSAELVLIGERLSARFRNVEEPVTITEEGLVMVIDKDSGSSKDADTGVDVDGSRIVV